MSKRTPRPEPVAGAIGRPIPRLEDERFLRGGGRYVSDLVARGDALRVAVLRSPHASARVVAVDAREALARPGVAAVLAPADVEGVGDLPCDWVPPEMDAVVTHPVLARGGVHYVGQPVAAVAAETPEAALDALEAVRVAYEPLPSAADQVAAAGEGAPLVHAGAPRNVAFRSVRRAGDPDRAFAAAEVVVARRLVNNRVVPAAMETRAALSAYDPADGTLLHHATSQLPHVHARSLAACLGLPLNRLRLAAPDIGGGFGGKLAFYAEDVICALLSMRTGRPCGWVEGRDESFVATTHGRDHVQYVELAARRDGTITGLRARLVADLGAFALGMGAGIVAINAGTSITGHYRVADVSETVEAVYTNRTPTGPYRGAGHPEATYLIERMVDALAVELGRDPAELRRQNLVPAAAMPYRVPIGMTLDTGDYAANLDRALELAGYAKLREEQRRARAEGRCLGIGVAAFSESCGTAPSVAMGAIGFGRAAHESARVAVHSDGKVTVFSGGQSQGQGHATSLAQVAADALGVDPSDVRLVQGDTGAVPFGTGTYNSRTMAVGGSAVHLAATKVMEKVRRIAAHKLQRRPGDLAYQGGRFSAASTAGIVAPVAHAAKKVEDRIKRAAVERKGGLGAPAMERGMASFGFADAAREAHLAHDLPLGMEPGLDETAFFDPKAALFSYGTHVATVEVDPETGHVALLGYVAVDDCGRVINPLLARGQVHGGLAQGIGQALMEHAAYDGEGRPLSGGFDTYAVPRASDLPRFETAHTEVPAKDNPLGAKGIGEGATICAPPTVAHAVLDALAPLGVTDLDMPLTPMAVWRAVEAARAARGDRRTEGGDHA